MDNQSAFWSLHPYVYGKTFPAFSFSSATATVATERKNSNGTTERHNGTTERQNGTAKRQQNGGNQALVVHGRPQPATDEKNHLTRTQEPTTYGQF